MSSQSRIEAPGGNLKAAQPPGRTAPRLANLQARVREGAAGHTAGYSNFVGFMRYALPLVALLLLGLVVIWPIATGRNDGFRISFANLNGIDASLRMENARYLGTTDNNQPYTITAVAASQPEPNSQIVNLDRLTADIFVDEGQWIALTADEGLYQRDVQLLDLAGSVTLYSDAGHEFHTDLAHVDLARGVAEGDTEVWGQGPLGLLNAGNFRMVERGDTLFFGDRVKLVLFPEAPK
jgi:lipopolysaccharide export system protein LptC